jgi:ADP-ribose pyrophosphatase YjhB (NUDIX family)
VAKNVNEKDLLRWAEALAGVAKTGIGFTQSQFEAERYEEILRIAAEIKSAALDQYADESEQISEWLKDVGEGVAGYVTPKVAVGAVVGNEKGEILLIQRADSGIWLYPTGWADVGYSPAEVVVKEVKEETGLDVEPVKLIAVFDGLRVGFTRVPLYSLVFYCKLLGGELKPHPLECLDAGWFSEDALPTPLAGRGAWQEVAFKAIKGEAIEVAFEKPRNPIWRGRNS